jgi:hypothetical protein
MSESVRILALMMFVLESVQRVKAFWLSQVLMGVIVDVVKTATVRRMKRV